MKQIKRKAVSILKAGQREFHPVTLQLECGHKYSTIRGYVAENHIGQKYRCQKCEEEARQQMPVKVYWRAYSYGVDIEGKEIIEETPCTVVDRNGNGHAKGGSGYHASIESAIQWRVDQIEHKIRYCESEIKRLLRDKETLIDPDYKKKCIAEFEKKERKS